MRVRTAAIVAHLATLHISDELYARLSRRAAASNTTVQAIVEPRLAAIETEPTTPADRDQAFAELIARADARANRYPPGFVADSSRESTYKGCGE